MQTMKVENAEGSYNRVLTPEKRAENREKHLLTFVIKATARDQEKNILISKLQREISDTVEEFEALKTEVKLKDKILHAKEDELLVIKSENEALKQQLHELMRTSKNKADDKASLKPDNVGLKRSNTISSPSTSPNSGVSRKRSMRKLKDSNVTNIFYNLRKKSKK